jgi:hypothetical protein
MKEFPPVKDRSQIIRLLANPKFILSALALLNLLAVPQRFAGLCFYNWRDTFYLAFTILVAALALWPARWWSYAGALFLTGTLLYDFSYVLLKVFNLIRRDAVEAESYPTPEIWLNIMQQHPEDLLHAALAAAIFSCAAIYFVRDSSHRRRLFA